MRGTIISWFGFRSIRCQAGLFNLFMVLVMVLSLSGCCVSAYTNKPIAAPVPHGHVDRCHASFDIQDQRGTKDVLVALALSGGGSRAAYFSASVMLKLQRVFEEEIDILEEVDVISAVSGGSLPAAYYCISRDPDGNPATSNRIWDEATVKDLMKRDYLGRWIGNWFWPANILRYWLTAYDRSDIMAQTFEDNLFDVKPYGWKLNFRDLNPERPYLIINATDGNENVNSEKHFGNIFTFTREDFEEKLKSDISNYSVARAVMASAAFPGAFNYMTLKDYRDPTAKDKRYLHVFDGGNADNLGLESIKRIITAEEAKGRNKRFKHYIVILVDSFKDMAGIDRNVCDPRSLISYAVDMNFMDSFDSLLQKNRDKLLAEFHSKTFVTTDGKITVDNLMFWHVNFDNVGSDVPDAKEENKSLRDMLNRIPTSFTISPDDTARLDQVVDIFVTRDTAALGAIKDILRSGDGKD